MGDQVGVAIGGSLKYVSYNEFERVLSANIERVKKAELFAKLCRINTLYMIARSGSGHIGSSFSSIDIMCWMQLYELRNAFGDKHNGPQDIFFSSKGHDAPGLYNTWIGLGRLDFELIHKLRRIDGLPGHPDNSTPNVITNTGSLGMGISKAKGMILANRLKNTEGNIYVLTGDGELQEGQFWESLISAINNKLHELTVIIDHNKLQSDTLVSSVSDLGDLEAKLSAFGWHVRRCNGNNLSDFSETLAASKQFTEMPKVIIADTVKGKGVSFMEHTSIDSDVELYKFHSGAPSQDAYVRAVEELKESANADLECLNMSSLELESLNRPAALNSENSQRLITAYSAALIDQARQNPKIVALDADLILDTGLIPFKEEFPNRFIECGIAEQDMVSQAGGMALRGLLPIVHSFACFLSARPNEQIYNNATEKTKIIYVGSLAGVVPGGPGHSHQAVRDISSLASIPNLVLLEPCCESEVDLLLDWSIDENESSCYLRLISLPWEVPYVLPKDYHPKLGVGVALTDGNDVAIFAYGPVMLSTAFHAAKKLEADHDIGVRVINLPWLNRVDSNWLIEEVASIKTLFSIDNHYAIGGQGDRILSALNSQRYGNVKLNHLALFDVPACGTNKEVLDVHGFASESIVKSVLAEIG